MDFGLDGSIHECVYRGHVFRFKNVIVNARNDTGWYMHSEEVLRHFDWDIKQGDNVLDIGASFGAWTLPALAAGANMVLAFEPHPVIINNLKENVVLNGWTDRLRAHCLALWSTTDEIVNLPVYSLSLMPGSGPHPMISMNTEPMMSVPTKRLDDIIMPDHVDWMKIDVEGAEIEVLRGARKTIEQHNPSIIIEWHSDRNQDPEMKYLKDNFAVVKPIHEGHFLVRLK